MLQNIFRFVGSHETIESQIKGCESDLGAALEIQEGPHRIDRPPRL
jgi:hypothetical protein